MWKIGCVDIHIIWLAGLHLIHQKGPVEPEYFECLKRNHKPPFLTEIDKDSTPLYENLFTSHSNPETLQVSEFY